MTRENRDTRAPAADQEPARADPGTPPPASFIEAAKELLGDRVVQAILIAGLLLGALEMGVFGR